MQIVHWGRGTDVRWGRGQQGHYHWEDFYHWEDSCWRTEQTVGLRVILLKGEGWGICRPAPIGHWWVGLGNLKGERGVG